MNSEVETKKQLKKSIKWRCLIGRKYRHFIICFNFSNVIQLSFDQIKKTKIDLKKTILKILIYFQFLTLPQKE